MARWHFGDEGTPHVAEADRQGCALIFSTEKPNQACNGLIFISLNVDVPGDQIHAEIEALDRLGVELEGKGRASLERPARLRVEAAGIRSGI
jgi:hypothetical protein